MELTVKFVDYGNEISVSKVIHAAVTQSRPQFGHKETSSGKASL